MSALTTQIQALVEFGKQNNEPSWFTKKRTQALKKAQELELPRFEKIKYKRWPIEVTKPVEVIQNKLPEAKTAEITIKDNVVVEFGQTTAKLKLDPKLKAQGVIVCDWQTALKEHPEFIEKYFMEAIKDDENRLNMQHAANVTSGLLIYVPKNIVVEEPLTSYFIQDATTNQDFVHHVLLIADVNSEVSYLENLQTYGEQKTTASVIVEVFAKAGSHVKFASVDRLGKNTTAYLNRRGHLDQDAKIDWSMGMMNDGNIVGDFDSDLIGDGSHAETKVVAISTGKQVQGIDTRVTNYGRHSIGHILQHGVILSRSSLVFNGIGHIIHGAKGADAQQESRVLMLSTKARGDANPILLIDDNAVTAGHAASVGRIDQDQLYYLMSRGLSKEIAERLVIRGFLGPVLTAIPSRKVQTELSDMIERKLIDGQDEK